MMYPPSTSSSSAHQHNRHNELLDDMEEIKLYIIDPHNISKREHHYPDHHSLPSIEQVRTDSSFHHGGRLSSISSCCSKQQFMNHYWVTKIRGLLKKRYVIASIVGFVTFIIILSICVAVSNNNNNDVVASPTSIGSNDMNNNTSALTAEQIQRYNKIIEILTVHNNISTIEDLETAGKAQNHALMWMVYRDFFFDLDKVQKAATERSSTLSNTSALTDILGDRKTMKNDNRLITQFIQRYITVLLYFAFAGTNWNNDCLFLTAKTSICEWRYYTLYKHERQPLEFTIHGSYCDKDSKFPVITHLLIPSNNLKGQIPKEIGFLTTLQYLSFYNNDLSGSLPSTMSQLTDLRFIQIGSNHFTGTVPSWIDKLSNLQYLGFSDNMLTGSIPSAIQSISPLEELDMSDNKLTGPIDFFDGKDCPQNLTLIYMQYNALNGSIHEGSFNSCNSLLEIDLSYNSITGHFPDHFYDMKIVNLRDNLLSGKLGKGTDVFNMRLEFLSLANNQFTGTVPDSINSMIQLSHLDLSNNQFNGSLGELFGDNAYSSLSGRFMQNIEYLYLSKNNFEPGPIPDKLMNAFNLKELSFADTNRIGPIPRWIDNNFPDLTLLDLHDNQLSGTIPKQLGYLKNVSYLLLNRNKLSGDVPDTFNDLKEAKTILLEKNSIVGSLDNICENQLKGRLSFFTSDCSEEEIICSCCTSCCSDTVEDCNPSVFLLAQMEKAKHNNEKHHYMANVEFN